MQCFTDNHGFRHIDVTPLPNTVASFLESDIQASVETADLFLTQVNQIMSGNLDIREATGNAFAIILTRDSVSIDCLWADDNCTLSLTEFRECLHAWRDFISGSSV